MTYNINSTFEFQDVVKSGGSMMATIPTIVILSSLFFVIGMVGIVGNFLVIYVVLSDRVMRSSITNLLITNLAISDLVIMIVCVPDIVQFMMNSGWRLGVVMCRTVRFLQVTALYTSVMTLVSVCIERYIAIVHPIQAHIVCCRLRILVIIVCTWPLSMLIASPQIFYNVIKPFSHNFTPCILEFPRVVDALAFKYLEFTVFYLIPLVLQIALYIRIGKILFNSDAMKRMEPVSGKKPYINCMRSRKGVVKMLIAGVVMYFICFSPHQVLLFYETFSNTPFEDTWSILIFTNIMAYASSASNPLLYSIFSNKFRRKLANTMCCCRPEQTGKAGYPILTMSNHVDRNGSNQSMKRKTFRFKSFRTTISEV
ncbi:hypothetical protein CHUAL_011128 [Chamberlinius hualienensis]